jgi:hypothetical protein
MTAKVSRTIYHRLPTWTHVRDVKITRPSSKCHLVDRVILPTIIRHITLPHLNSTFSQTLAAADCSESCHTHPRCLQNDAEVIQDSTVQFEPRLMRNAFAFTALLLMQLRQHRGSPASSAALSTPWLSQLPCCQNECMSSCDPA